MPTRTSSGVVSSSLPSIRANWFWIIKPARSGSGRGAIPAVLTRGARGGGGRPPGVVEGGGGAPGPRRGGAPGGGEGAPPRPGDGPPPPAGGARHGHRRVPVHVVAHDDGAVRGEPVSERRTQPGT